MQFMPVYLVKYIVEVDVFLSFLTDKHLQMHRTGKDNQEWECFCDSQTASAALAELWLTWQFSPTFRVILHSVQNNQGYSANRTRLNGLCPFSAILCLCQSTFLTFWMDCQSSLSNFTGWPFLGHSFTGSCFCGENMFSPQMVFSLLFFVIFPEIFFFHK